jgi:hypothetical protein
VPVRERLVRYLSAFAATVLVSIGVLVLAGFV